MGERESRSRSRRGRDAPMFAAIGRTIRLARTARGLSQVELAELAGLSGPYVSQIETGTKRPSSEALLAIAEALGVAAHELLAEAAAPSHPWGSSPPPPAAAAPPAPASAPPPAPAARAARPAAAAAMGPPPLEMSADSASWRYWRNPLAMEVRTSWGQREPEALAPLTAEAQAALERGSFGAAHADADQLVRMLVAYLDGRYRSVTSEHLFLASSALRHALSTAPDTAEAVVSFATSVLAEQLADFVAWEATAAPG